MILRSGSWLVSHRPAAGRRATPIVAPSVLRLKHAIVAVVRMDAEGSRDTIMASREFTEMLSNFKLTSEIAVALTVS